MTTKQVTAITLRDWRSFGSRGGTLDLQHGFLAVIGPNNSGKSSLIRSIYELRAVLQTLGQWSAGDGNLLNFLSGRLGVLALNLLEGERVAPFIGGKSPRVLIEFSGDAQPEAADVSAIEIVLGPNAWSAAFILADGSRFEPTAEISAVGVGGGRTFLRLHESGPIVDWDTLSAAIRPLGQSMYVGAFRNAINSGGGAYYDLQVGRDFINAFDAAKNGTNPESNEAVITMLQELRDIFGFTSLDVSVSQDSSHLIYAVDGRSLRSSELGAGISQFVVVAGMVMVRRPWILLIDEPELNLHASLQNRFLSLLARYVEGPVVFSTHSLGLARTAADKVIVCDRGPDGSSRTHEFSSTPSLALTLGQLGYGGYSDEAYQAVLLVEGVTDVRVFKELLSKYGIGNQVVVIALGGDALAQGGRDYERDELRRLSLMVFAIVDGEAESAESGPTDGRIAFQTNATSAGFHCHLLARRSIENYLSQDLAREEFICPEAPAFGHFEKPPADWSWSKDRNWRIAAGMSRADFEATDLGNFLQTLSDAVHARSERADSAGQ